MFYYKVTFNADNGGYEVIRYYRSDKRGWDLQEILNRIAALEIERPYIHCYEVENEWTEKDYLEDVPYYIIKELEEEQFYQEIEWEEI